MIRLRNPFAVSLLGLAVLSLCACSSVRGISNPDQSTLVPIKPPISSEVIGHDTNHLDELPIAEDALVPVELAPPGSVELPDKSIDKNLVFASASLSDAMQSVSDAFGVQVAVAPSRNVSGSTGAARATTTFRDSSLKEVMVELSESFSFFYSYDGKTLRVQPERQFVVPIPPVNDLMESLPIMVERMGARSVFLDKSSRTLFFIAGRNEYREIVDYLRYIRENKSLIVYDTYIWEVLLSDESALGIRWDQFKVGFGGKSPDGTKMGSAGVTGGSDVSTPGGLGLNVVYNSENFSMNLLLNFLRTQGTVNSLSQPRLAVISGGIASFRDGNVTNYVSNIGSVVSNNTTNTTVTTDKVVSGVDMALTGDVSDGTIFTDVRLSLASLLRFNPFSALGTTLSLPQTSQREVHTTIRSRGGDTVLLAGLNSRSSSNDVTGVPGLGDHVMLTAKDKNEERREMVIVLRPRVVKFTRATSKPTAKEGA